MFSKLSAALVAIFVSACGLCCGTACRAQDSTTAEALGLSYMHGSDNVWYLRPNHPKFLYLRAKFRDNGIEGVAWSPLFIRETEQLLGAPASQIDRIAVGICPHATAYTSVIHGSFAVETTPGSRGVSKQQVGNQVYYLLPNLFVLAKTDRSTVLYGTEPEIRVALARKANVPAGLPSIKQLGDPQAITVSLSTIHVWEVQTLHIHDDGIVVRRLTQFHPSNPDALQQHIDGVKVNANTYLGTMNLTPQQATYRSALDNNRLTETFTIRGLGERDWKQLGNFVGRFTSPISGFGVMALHHEELMNPDNAELLVSSNARLLQHAVFGSDREALETSTIRLLSRCVYSDQGIKALEGVLEKPGSPKLFAAAMEELNACKTARATILYDRALAAYPRFQPQYATTGYVALRYYLRHGEDAASAAACRILARLKPIEHFSNDLRQLAVDPKRDMSVRAAASQSLVDAGFAAVPGVDLDANLPVDALNLDNTSPMSEDALTDLLRKLDGGSAIEQHDAIASLRAIDIDPRRRDAVIDLLLPYIADPAIGRAARDALTRWVDRNALPLLANAFTKNRYQTIKLDHLIGFLQELKLRGQVVSLVEVCHVLLTDPDARAGALPAEIMEHLIEQEPFQSEDVPYLLALADVVNWRFSDDLRMKVLELNDPRILPFVVNELEDGNYESKIAAKETLIRFGPQAERAMIEAVKTWGMVHEPARVLAEIGTTRSLPDLKARQATVKLKAGNIDIRQELQDAIDSINVSKRRPADLSSLEVANYVTRESIRLAERMISHRISIDGVPPDEATASRILTHVRDGWQQPLEYQLGPQGQFLIRSHGSDRRAKTSDDIYELTPARVPATSEGIVEALVASSAPSADRSVATAVLPRLNTSELTEAQSTQCVVAAIRLLNHHETKQVAFDWLVANLQTSHLALLDRSLGYYPLAPIRDKDYLKSIQTLRSIAADESRPRPAPTPATDELTGNAEPGPTMRSRPPQGGSPVTPRRDPTRPQLDPTDVVAAPVPARTHRVPDRQPQAAAKFNAVLAALNDSSLTATERHLAMCELKGLALNEDQKAELRPVLETMIDDRDISAALAAFTVFQEIGVPDDSVKDLFRWASNPSLATKANAELARIANEEVLEELEQRLVKAPRITDPAFQLAIQLGATAESCLWPVLDRDVAFQGRALSVLSQIGTENTIAHLQQTDHNIQAQRLQPTIDQIRRRQAEAAER